MHSGYGRDRMIDDFFVDEGNGFDEEDYDDVTDDTLEFLSLDDDMIESYNRKQKKERAAAKRAGHRTVGRKARRPEEDRYADDMYEKDEYDEEVYEDDGYDGEEGYEDGGYDGEEVYEDDGYDREETYEEEGYDEYEDEGIMYEDDEYDDAYEEDEYEYDDPVEEYDEYDEEEYEYDAYAEDGVIVRFKEFLTHMTGLDMVVAMLGIVVLAGVFLAGGLYANAKSVEKQVNAFASVGEEMEGISVIGESGLIAVSESARLSGMIDMEEEAEEEPEEKPEADKQGSIEVSLNLTSIQSDLKIKFVNKATGKLIGSVPFEVEVSGAGKTLSFKDEDKDGIIYQTGIASGEYSVKIKPLTEDKYAEYILPSAAGSVTVTDKIAYKKVDVADEVKSEAEVNAAVEDTAKQNTAVESVLTDTVEWVESTRTPVGEGQESYKEVNKKDIPDPWTVSSAYRKLAEAGGEDPAVIDFSIALDRSSLTLKPGESAALKVSVSGSSASPSVTWKSSAPDIATVDGSGNVSAVSAGDATITVEVTIGYMIEEASCSVKVAENGTAPEKPEDPAKPENPTDPSDPEKPVKTKVTLSSTAVSLEKGESVTLTVQTVSGEVQSVEWISSNPSVAAVNKGVVTAVGAGNADVTARVKAADGSQDLVCKVTVQDKEKSGQITISGDSEVAVGKTVSLTVKTEPEGRKVIWSSSNEKTARVDDKGVVTGIAVGTAEIRAVCSDAENISAVHKITVKDTAAVDGSAKLKDKDGNQMYYLDAGGTYKEAVYDDYKKYDKFYRKSSEATAYRYTGWQTIDGYVYFYDKNGNYVTGEQIIQGARYTFGSDGRMASNSGTMGIDVSKWNGSIDWNAVKNSGVSYVIIRCGYRGSSTGVLVEDPKFRSNIKGAKAAGLKVGAYFFSQAVNEVEAVEEASMALNLVSGYGLSYPIFMDVEASGGRGDGISKETRTAVCRAFCATVQNSGYAAGIYANKTWFTEKISTGSLTGYKIWLAQYASAPSYTATRYDMWQYSAKGRVSGISGNVDMNISYLHY